MRNIVLTSFAAWTVGLEGVCNWMYPDVLGKVTTGEGDLVDSISEAQALEWHHPAGTIATPGEVAAAWTVVKNSGLEKLGGYSAKVQALTTIRLTQDGVAKLVRGKLLSDEAILRTRVGSLAWDALCADAQFGTLSLSWACGPWMKFPNFLAALQREDFARWDADKNLLPGCCAKECFMPPAANPGNKLTKRNAANQAFFVAAQHVVDQNLDPDVLHYSDPALADTNPDL